MPQVNERKAEAPTKWKTFPLNLINLQKSGDDRTVKLTFDIVLKDENAPEGFIRELSDLEGVSVISLVSSKHDVDY